MSKLFDRLLETRNLGSDFLHPQYESLSDPFILADMNKAIARIKQAIGQKEQILIYGDYDVDGVTASTVMEQTLVFAGADPGSISIMLPDRFADGYGMSQRLVQRAKDFKIPLVITVDCGSRNHEIVEALNKLGTDTIITDHHETDPTLPPALAVINPHRQDHPTVALQNLAGVGVAFKLAQALVRQGLIKPGREKWLLDLVLIGTICDSMLLTGENRILGFYGLKVLAKTRRPGLQELIRRAGVKKLNAESIGFQLGPRLNAAGRLDTAETSLNLLRAKTAIDAATLAEKIEQLNKKRKDAQNLATGEIRTRGISNDPVIVEAGDWHEGILGIIAGHLVEDYTRPAFVLTATKDGTYKGSGRSFGDFNLAEALNYAKDTIVGGGGHAGAAGVRIAADRLTDFRTKINEYYRSLHLSDQSKYLERHVDLALTDFSDLNLTLLDDLSLLEPYGPGNEEPVFRLESPRVAGVTRMGSERNHLRLDLCDQQNKRLKCLAFAAPKHWLNLDPAVDHISPLVQFNENEYRGVKSLEARIVDLGFLEV